MSETKTEAFEHLANAAQAHAHFLDAMAFRLDGWAQESREGGWSTHQVTANRSAADDCRKLAGSLRADIATARALSNPEGE